MCLKLGESASPAKRTYFVVCTVVFIVLTPMLGYGTIVLLGNLKRSCEIGINSSANSFDLVLVVLPLVMLLVAVWTIVAFVVLRRRPVVAVVVAIAGAVAIAYICAIVRFNPAEIPMSSSCKSSGRPDWWPAWLPL